MLRQRALSAAIGLPVLYGLIFLDGYPGAYGLPLLAVVVVVSMFGTEEFRRMLANRGFQAPRDMGLMMGALPPLFLYFYHYRYNDIVLLALTLGIVVDVLMLALSLIGDIGHRMSGGSRQLLVGRGESDPAEAKPASPPALAGGTLGALRDFALLALGAGYVGGLMSYLILLRRMDHAAAAPWGIWPVALVIAAVWIADTAAFAAGKLLDGPKLWPRVSPGKTVAGTAAGIAACAIVLAIAAASTQAEGVRLVIMAAAAGALLGIAGLLGDLAESAVKRWARVKDSGNIVVGHGGVLDRFDSLMWAAPAFFYILLIWGASILAA